MHAVDEQRKYGEDEFIIYKKMNKELIMSAPQDEASIHYSTGIPSKNPDDYESFKTFSTFTKMKNWLEKQYGLGIDKDQFFHLEQLMLRQLYNLNQIYFFLKLYQELKCLLFLLQL